MNEQHVGTDPEDTEPTQPVDDLPTDTADDTEGHSVIQSDFHRPPSTPRSREGIEWTDSAARKGSRVHTRQRHER
jgi:hypothetical protein